MYRKNTAGQFLCFQGVDVSTGGIKSGVTWTIRRSIDGTFAAGGGTVTEDGSTGWYKYAMAQADTNGNDVGFNFTGTGAVPQTVNIITTACDPTVATNFGITSLPTTAVTTNASLLTSGSGTDQLLVSSGAAVLTTAGYQAAADALLGRNVGGGSSSGRIVKEALYFLRNKWTVSSGTLTVYAVDDSTSSWTATVSTDAAAIPIIGNDPA